MRRARQAETAARLSDWLRSPELNGRMSVAVNKPVGDNARKGAVKKRSQVKTRLGGATAWTKRSKKSGEFMAVKKPAKKTKAPRPERSKVKAGWRRGARRRKRRGLADDVDQLNICYGSGLGGNADGSAHGLKSGDFSFPIP